MHIDVGAVRGQKVRCGCDGDLCQAAKTEVGWLSIDNSPSPTSTISVLLVYPKSQLSSSPVKELQRADSLSCLGPACPFSLIAVLNHSSPSNYPSTSPSHLPYSAYRHHSPHPIPITTPIRSDTSPSVGLSSKLLIHNGQLLLRPFLLRPKTGLRPSPKCQHPQTRQLRYSYPGTTTDSRRACGRGAAERGGRRGGREGAGVESGGGEGEGCEWERASSLARLLHSICPLSHCSVQAFQYPALTLPRALGPISFYPPSLAGLAHSVVLFLAVYLDLSP